MSFWWSAGLCTALILACTDDSVHPVGGWAEVVKMLLANGAAVNVRNELVC